MALTRREAIGLLTSLPGVKSVAVAEVKPEDVIVLECDVYLTQDQLGFLREQMAQIWPGRKIVVLERGMSLRVFKELP
jgi:hypothetical protein